MIESYDALSKLSVDDLKERYDKTAKTTNVGLSFYREEIARREAEAQNRIMFAFTKQVRDMTIAITVMTLLVLALTVINIVLVWPS
ncbi:hypothetical protein J3P71_17670 [Rhizobium leguminosarum]|uniref:hypothetical protein n=1 Tax=Rhizobium leguminosarum TaxID=384 RepID=UPI001441430A|nr:hypothetical protein [Rhizobium leguminosarum]MBY5838061.1 hypothetical protein [Rhizobium leguminosarum]NKM82250.1 hypothetical protein [Rhizobium leguminosarum bv. viciae]QSZ06698.1 hypothetical protein J3P71_17670 [Rhizobium leguminosarum]